MTATTNVPALHPAIGTLIRNGETVFYAYLADNVYVEGTADELAFYLQLEAR
jgi:hypothetical protein